MGTVLGGLEGTCNPLPQRWSQVHDLPHIFDILQGTCDPLPQRWSQVRD